MLQPVVHIELASIDRLVAAEAALRPDEAARLARIQSPRRREQFLAGRRLARSMLARIVGGVADDWSITADTDIRPAVVDRPGWHLSISHRADYVACAVANVAIGIDLEHTKPGRDTGAMATFVCQADELALVSRQPPAAREWQFLSFWTLKEAHLKLRGETFDIAHLHRVQVRDVDTVEANGISWQFNTAGMVLSLVTDAALKAEPKTRFDTAPDRVSWYRVG
ncbi:MAG: 4'-phosphopantetheinyl transferase superfamily protein [Burkholderiales bacterium]|nr:4'-phosphopantetheinyl transferase superfamily protein [Burkholderiales bacterium]